jgi:hypothetical protein
MLTAGAVLPALVIVCRSLHGLTVGVFSVLSPLFCTPILTSSEGDRAGEHFGENRVDPADQRRSFTERARR